MCIYVCTFVLRLLKGHCYGNQLIYGLFANIELTSFILCSGIPNGMHIAICIRALTLAMMPLYSVKIW